MNGIRTRFQTLFPLLLISLGSVVAQSADDDRVIDERRANQEAATAIVPAQNVNRGVVVFQNGVLLDGVVAPKKIEAFENPGVIINVGVAPNEAAFERLIFSQYVDGRSGRQSLDTSRERAINLLNATCQLTDQQKEKLDLAGRIDLNRFMERVKTAREKFHAGADDRVAVQAELQRLRAKTRTGILGPDSFFAKSLRLVLNEKQLAILDERRWARHCESTRNPLRDIEKIITLDEGQRKAIVQIMLDETPCDPTLGNSEALVGNYERMVMLYRLSCSSEEKIKPLLSAEQWQKLQPRLAEFQGFQTYLVQRGVIDAKQEAELALHRDQRLKESK